MVIQMMGAGLVTEMYVIVFRTLVAGLVLALVRWLIQGRKAALADRSVAGFALAAGLLALLGDVVARLMGVSPLLPLDVPSFLSTWYGDYRFVMPLLSGLLGVGLLALPVRAHGGRGAADLARRSLVSFARGRWFIAPAVVLALVLLLTIPAGAASRPDPMTGRYTDYLVDIGGGSSMGSGIYGWFYSVPSMIVIGVLIVVAAVAMSLVARPALSANREQDVRVRTTRTRNIVLMLTGALLVHLGHICSSLAGTAMMRSMFSTSQGPVSHWTTFAALEPALTFASLLCATLGVALWATVALSGIPSRRGAQVTARS